MAFPGTYNINYYRGDTYEFRIYPKNSNGDPFPLAGYGVKFAFSTTRGGSGTTGYHEAYAQIIDNLYILCAIRPGDAEFLVPGTQYVFDVEISKSGTPYSLIHTVLTGNISVTDQVGVSGVPISSVLHSITYYSDPATTTGTLPRDNNKYIKDQIVSLFGASTISNPGSQFIGWSLNPDGTGNIYHPGDTIIMGTEDITLYAQWENI